MRYASISNLTNRCILTGRSRVNTFNLQNIILPFKLSPIEFRRQALAGDLPGVKKRVN